MGSEGPPPTVFHVTGFKKFHGVVENPTETLVNALWKYLVKRGAPPGTRLGSFTVLETAGNGALDFLLQLLDSAIPQRSEHSLDATGAPSNILNPAVGDERVVWVHMGVNSGASKFAIERRALNEANFRCPDELGWQPQRIPVISEDGGLSYARESTLPIPELVEKLSKQGYDVTLSDDAGRFVCNYVYYHSLHHAAAHGTSCVFVHVPLFTTIEEEKQVQFLASLFDVLAEVS